MYKKPTVLMAVLAAGVAMALVGSALAVPPPGKGKNKNQAITASVSEPVTCVALDDASVSPVTEIEVGKDEPQCVRYTITLPAAGGVALFEDALLEDFDFDGRVHDENDAIDQEDWLAGVLDDTCPDGNCDGFDFGVDLAIDGICTNGTFLSPCSGIVVELISGSGTCDVFVSRPDSHVKLNKGNIPPKQVEYIAMQKNDDAVCKVTVYAATVGNPGSVVFVGGDAYPANGEIFNGLDADGDDPGKANCLLAGEIVDCVDNPGGEVLFSVFEPAGCRYAREHTRYDADEDGVADLGLNDVAGDLTGDGIVDDADAEVGIINTPNIFVDYVSVNRGVKAWDADGTMQLESKNVPTTDLTSIQLDPAACRPLIP